MVCVAVCAVWFVAPIFAHEVEMFAERDSSVDGEWNTTSVESFVSSDTAVSWQRRAQRERGSQVLGASYPQQGSNIASVKDTTKTKAIGNGKNVSAQDCMPKNADTIGLSCVRRWSLSRSA